MTLPHAKEERRAAEFFRRLPAQIKPTANRFGVKGTDFDDLCQEVYFKMITSDRWRSNDGSDDPASIEGLLMYATGIANRQLCDDYRLNRRTSSLQQLSDIPSPAADPSWSPQSDDLWAAMVRDAETVAPPPPEEFIHTYFAVWRSQGSISSAEISGWVKEFRRSQPVIYVWKGLIEDAVAVRIRAELTEGPV